MDNNTIYLNVKELQKREKREKIKSIMREVYAALEEKGYNSINQICGYLVSSDPTYITNHNNARALITQVEREDILEAITEEYIEKM
ncbi:MAG: IreB family regulatory phosphoprotein [Clostridiales bacterium]|nr:IreB family regulatory phosphoprotein [Clostridiales bacterium]